MLLSFVFSPGTEATVVVMFTIVSSGGSRLSGSVTVAFSPLATRCTVFDSVIGYLPLSRSILTVTFMLNSSLSPWLVNATEKAWPAT